MKIKIRLFYRLFLLSVLFGSGLMIAAGLFPAMNLVCSAGKAKNLRDSIKKRWLRSFGVVINLHIITEGSILNRTTFLAANHISWLDIIAIGQYLPACFVAKSEILSWPVIGYLSRQAGTVFIRRGDKKNILATSEKMSRLLKQNGNIIAFPEGTTTVGDDVLNFHASLFQPALSTNSAIQPVAIQYRGAAKEHAPFVGDDTFIRHLITILTLDKIEASLSFLPAINTLEKNRQSVSEEARQMILTSISCETVLTYSKLHPIPLAQKASGHHSC